ncbi:MAG: hypothetical protein L0G94_07230 [Brachybacterium sp.]|uniref:hypothetical protein n=1 Tax=Brachybacterium sp. TaxID=1891286 RepID=UPI002648E183|nr:hypothetical protein [Brachybacterium sp.]MDN5686463.1 hypothetical protein [Brachybacterium sp.]
MTWQKDLGIGRYGSKMRARVDLVSQNLSANRSYIRVRIYAYNGGYSRTYNVGTGALVAVSGTVDRSERVTFDIGGHSWGTLADWYFTVDHASSGKLNFAINHGIADTGTSALGNGGTVKLTGSLPSLILPPATPSGDSTQYLSPDRIRYSWTNESTARAPYSRLDVQCWHRSSNKWWSHGSLSESATSYTDSSIPGNNQVRYRVRAVGPGGRSGWQVGGLLGTMPTYPTDVHAVKSGQSIRVGWTDESAMTNNERTFIIADNPDGTGWVDVGTIGGSAQSWTHTDADPAVTHQYKVATRITSQITMTSNYSAHSNVVQLQAPPRQPGRVAPLLSITQVIGDAITFEWSHNPVDTTAQSAAEFQYRIDEGAWSTTPVGADQHVTITPDVGGLVRAQLDWRVRTKGAHPDWSPWSTVNGPLLSTVPYVAIQDPADGTILDTSRIAASWSYGANGEDPHLAQAEFNVRLLAGGDLLEQQTGGTAESVPLETRLDNATEYTVEVEARNGDGLWSAVDAATFTTDFPLPQPVLCFPSWDHDTATVAISFGEQEVDGHTVVDAIDVERRDAGGDWILIASGIETSTSIVDRTPRIGTVEYRAISRTVLPTETVGPETTAVWVHDRDPVYVAGGPGMDQLCLARGSSASDDVSVEQALHQFAGQAKPTAFFGDGQEYTTHFSGRILPHYPYPTSTRDEWVALLRERGLVCFRDCTGRKVFGVLTVAFSTSGNVGSVELDVQETRYTEGVRRVSDLDLEAMSS